MSNMELTQKQREILKSKGISSVRILLRLDGESEEKEIKSLDELLENIGKIASINFSYQWDGGVGYIDLYQTKAGLDIGALFK